MNTKVVPWLALVVYLALCAGALWLWRDHLNQMLEMAGEPEDGRAPLATVPDTKPARPRATKTAQAGA